MPRKHKPKKKAAHAKVSPRPPPNVRYPVHSAQTQQSAAPALSMREEGRYFEKHRSRAFEPGVNLRDKPIAFVSAGLLASTVNEATAVEDVDQEVAVAVDAPDLQKEQPDLESPTTTQAMADMHLRTPSPAPSDSSVEEIVFKGRGAQAKAQPQPVLQTSGKSSSLPTAPTVKPPVQTVPSAAPHEQRGRLQELDHSPIPRATSTSSATTALPRRERSQLRATAAIFTPSTSETSTPFQSQTQSISVPSASVQSQWASDSAQSSDSRLQPVRDIAVVPEISSATEASTASRPTAEEQDFDSYSDEDSILDGFGARRLGGKSKWETNTTPWVSRSKPGIGWLPVVDRPTNVPGFVEGRVMVPNRSSKDEALDDYMENIRQSMQEEHAVGTFAKRPLDVGDSYDDEFTGFSTTDDTENSDSAKSDDWQNLDELSTSADAGLLQQILKTRTRSGQTHYLVVYEGVTDACWRHARFLTSVHDLTIIDSFERAAVQTKESWGGHVDSSTASELSDDSEEDDDDTDELHEELDDETIARVLAKQEELGLGSDEILLYGGDAHFGTSGFAESSDAFLRPSNRRARRVGSSHRSRRSQPSYPSASAFADALEQDPYGGFDVMDTERPSLKPKKKGRRGKMPVELELSDDDLAEQLRVSWEADRAKKRVKKAEREELRQQGLLGRKGKGPDLSVRYKDGFSLMEIVEEIREFLASDQQTLSLPPMEAQRRATVHQFVHNLGLSSKSRGGGNNRFTVLSKTHLTRYYADDEFDALVEKKRFKNRLKAMREPAGSKKGPRIAPQAGYKHGETVGGSAPEIGAENRGHALLAKMGWKKGMALGAEDNKGILQPVAHTFKSGRAGL